MPIQLRTCETVCLSVRPPEEMDVSPTSPSLPSLPPSLRQLPSLPPFRLLLIAPSIDLRSLSSSSRGWSFTCVSAMWRVTVTSITIEYTTVLKLYK